jgi:hypothetical protein
MRSHVHTNAHGDARWTRKMKFGAALYALLEMLNWMQNSLVTA